ncbi:hypothetical protein OIU34_38405 [Pararhizobium sp. BT-229]|uniref:hypothetical protein n=1 Tax=Pararhizobium sp. BT-229 TaxID=2986923 RepID=UPI0021F6B108|nr:hypothetical protein [Pararhizobium sp. BT-229]MCV9967697.1 hypothetical protein [Pararhizobium sp. BT-229]
MAVFFRTPITDATAFEMIEERLSSRSDFDGYFNVYGADDELTVSWTPAMSSAVFKEQVTDALRSTWQKTRFWRSISVAIAATTSESTKSETRRSG